MSYPKRLIEVDLPIKRISAHARREKSIRHGHISTLHMWWARRPLAACRAVLCASLWPDPADPLCPQAFRAAAAREIRAFCQMVYKGTDLTALCDNDAWKRYGALAKRKEPLDLKTLPASLVATGNGQAKDSTDLGLLRDLLLDFIADFAAWESSTNEAFVTTARNLTQAAHEALGGAPGTRPLIVDPFAGGGSIPLEAIRIGADAFGSDLNPVAVLLNKVVLEYIPRYGQQLAQEIRKWGQWVKAQAEKELGQYYPVESSGNTPVAYLWARAIQCEGPGCGAEVPLIRSLWLAKKGRESVALKFVPRPRAKRVDCEIVTHAKAATVGDGTVKRGSATCPCCGYTTPAASVRQQLIQAEGGADTSKLLTVVFRSADAKTYRQPTERELLVVKRMTDGLKRAAVIPPIPLPLMSGVFNVPLYGITRWDLLFSARQLVTANVLVRHLGRVEQELRNSGDPGLSLATEVLLHLAFGKYLDFRSTLCTWITVGEKIGHTFGRQALGMIFDWAEGVPFGDISGSWERSIEYIAEFVEMEAKARSKPGVAEQVTAQRHTLPDDCAQAFITDPPYYNAVPYADLSDFFYPWLKRSLGPRFPSLFIKQVAPKDDEICEMNGWDPVRYARKDAKFYEDGMRSAFVEANRYCIPTGIGVVVFAHKTTAGWESLLSALVDSGLMITASWPIDTERSGRLRAMGSAALASSVHLVCRPREIAAGPVNTNSVGDWREVLQELPKRIHEWMPRLAAEGVVGADAIFACLGPALEIFSRYSRVEKASGEKVTLKDYLEYVWAAVAQEALKMVFEGADASGFEEDARLTAMWLWTLSTGNGKELAQAGMEDTEDGDDAEDNGDTGKGGGYVLEYDAARKIAQGLGAHLEELAGVASVNGAKARLLGVAERTRHLFGRDEADTPGAKKGKKKLKQGDLFASVEDIEAEEGSWGEKSVPKLGTTVLDRVHQSMILFAAGRGEAVKRFLVEEGVGRDTRFWKLAQALSALYPTGTDEKRWVDGVLARKKSLGF